MMQRYRLIFDGHIQPNATREEVQRLLADLFKVDPVEIEALFSKPPVTLKQDLDYDEALTDKASFEATGAICRLEAQPSSSGFASWGRKRRPSDRPAAEATTSSPSQRQFGLGPSCYLAFASRAFYADVAAHWRGAAFVHLLLVLLLSTAVYLMHFNALITTLLAEEAPPIIAQIPEIRIQNGKVQVNVEEPYYIHHPDSGKLFAVIDTTGEITSLRQTEAVLLLTGSRLAARLSAGDSRILDLSQIESLQIDQDGVSQWLQSAQKWSPFLLFPLVLGFSFILRSLQALLYGSIGMVIASLQNSRLPLGATVSVAIMAMTPVILLDALLVLLDIYLPLWGLGGFLLAMGYLFFGIRAAVRPSQ